MADAKKPEKGEKKTEKSTAQKLVDAVKSTAKAVTDAVSHPVETLKHPVDTAKKLAKPATDAMTGGAGASDGGEQPAARPGKNGVRIPLVRGRRRALLGTVRSDKMDKTVVVEVTSLKRDPVYGKYLKDRMRYKAHDEKNQYHTGDRVEIKEHRPLSRDKRWIVSRLIERAKVE